MSKIYNTPKRTHIVKTRLDDEEHAEFLHQVEIYGMSQSEFIREASPVQPSVLSLWRAISMMPCWNPSVSSPPSLGGSATT